MTVLVVPTTNPFPVVISGTKIAAFHFLPCPELFFKRFFFALPFRVSWQRGDKFHARWSIFFILFKQFNNNDDRRCFFCIKYAAEKQTVNEINLRYIVIWNLIIFFIWFVNLRVNRRFLFTLYFLIFDSIKLRNSIGKYFFIVDIWYNFKNKSWKCNF